MDKELPPPLLPEDVDVRDFPDLPISVQRFRDSALVSTRSDAEIVAAVMLWLASFHQIPAASLPANDVEIAKLAGYGRALREFKRVRDGAMHGLIMCSDGRFWHPVVAEKAVVAWNKKLAERHRKAVDRARKYNDERRYRGEPPIPLPHPPYRLARDEDSATPLWHYVDAGGNLATPKRRGHPPESITNSHGILVVSDGIPAICSDGIPAAKEKGSEGNSKAKPSCRAEPDGFTRFWKAWPAGPRKVARAKCREVWTRKRLEDDVETIVSHVAMMRESRQWRDGYDPAPLTYLNQRRWEDGDPAERGGDGAPSYL